jgi:hypothetical protein
MRLAAAILLGKTTPVAKRAVTVYPDDLFLVSYPRSGNTWLRFLIGNLLQPTEPVTFANIEHKIPDIYQNSDRALLKLPRPRVLKSHEYFDPRYRQVIYVIRDPRDVAVSYYHYQIKVRRIPDGYPIDEFVAGFVAGRIDHFGSWGEHVGSWLGARQDTKDFLHLRYEDLLVQPTIEIRKVATLLGIDIDQTLIDQAIEASSARRMRQMEDEQADAWRPIRASRKDKPFVRLARAGGWHTELSPGATQQIERTWATWMTLFGYLP